MRRQEKRLLRIMAIQLLLVHHLLCCRGGLRRNGLVLGQLKRSPLLGCSWGSFNGFSRYGPTKSSMDQDPRLQNNAPSRMAFSEASGSISSWVRSHSVLRALRMSEAGGNMTGSPTYSPTPQMTFSGGVHCANVWCFPRIFGTCIFQIFISDMLRCFIHLHIYRILRKRIRPITISEYCSQPEARILPLVLTYGLWLIHRSLPFQFARKGLYHDTRASWDTYTKLVRCDTSLRSIEATYQSDPYPSKHRTDSGTHQSVLMVRHQAAAANQLTSCSPSVPICFPRGGRFHRPRLIRYPSSVILDLR
jgi:hypothetical protein